LRTAVLRRSARVRRRHRREVTRRLTSRGTGAVDEMKFHAEVATTTTEVAKAEVNFTKSDDAEVAIVIKLCSCDGEFVGAGRGRCNIFVKRRRPSSLAAATCTLESLRIGRRPSTKSSSPRRRRRARKTRRRRSFDIVDGRTGKRPLLTHRGRAKSGGDVVDVFAALLAAVTCPGSCPGCPRRA
jgi:hypothetical protein